MDVVWTGNHFFPLDSSSNGMSPGVGGWDFEFSIHPVPVPVCGWWMDRKHFLILVQWMVVSSVSVFTTYLPTYLPTNQPFVPLTYVPTFL